MSDNQEKPFLGIPTPLWNSMIAAIVTVILSYMSIRTQQQVKDSGDETKTAVVKAEKAVTKTAEAVTEVKAAVEEKDDKLNDISKVGKQTHSLVNGAMSAQLKVNAELARAKAELTRDPIDEAAADLAEKNLKEHEARQE